MDLIKEIYFKMAGDNLMESGLFDESGSTAQEIISLIKSSDEELWEEHIESAVVNAQADTGIKAFREGFKAAFRLMREVSE